MAYLPSCKSENKYSPRSQRLGFAAVDSPWRDLLTQPQSLQNNEQLRHDIEQAVAVLNAIGLVASIVATVFSIAGWLLLLTGVGASFTPLAFFIGKIAGVLGAIVGCVSALAEASIGTFKKSSVGGCILSIVAAAVGSSLGAVKGLIAGLTRRETLETVREFERIAAGVGVNFDLAGLLVASRVGGRCLAAGRGV